MKTNQDLYSSIDGTYYDVSFNKSKDALQGASPFILNADINYSPTFGNYKPTANLVFSYFSDRIDVLPELFFPITRDNSSSKSIEKFLSRRKFSISILYIFIIAF